MACGSRVFVSAAVSRRPRGSCAAGCIDREEREEWMVSRVTLEGMYGRFSSRRCNIGSFGLSVRSGRFIVFMNPSKYKGSAALHVVTNLRRVASNRL